MLTGGFSEVNRAERVAAAKAEFRAAIKGWPLEALETYIARHYPAYWLKVDVPHKIAQAHFVRDTEQAGKRLATSVGFDVDRGVTELTIYAPDHPWLLSIIAGACALAGANIVDAQIYTTTDGLALDTIAVSREFEQEEDEARRAARIGDVIEKAVRGEIKLPDVVPKRAPPKGRLKAFAIEPEVTINNQWSQRYTVVEVTGLDRPGLLYELTTTLSQLNLNIASAHVATFGERVVDVFYVTDLLGAKITTPTRQAAIKRPLIALFTLPGGETKPAQETAAEQPIYRLWRTGNRPLNRALYRAATSAGTGLWRGDEQAGRKRAQDAGRLELRLRPQDRTGGPPAARGDAGRRRRDDAPSRPKTQASSRRRQGPFHASAVHHLLGRRSGAMGGHRRDRHAGVDRHPSAADPVARNSQATALGPHPGRQRRHARNARRHGRRRRAAARTAGLRAQGVHRHRGSPLLFPSRGRSAGNHARPQSATSCVAAPRKADRPSRSSLPRTCS